MPMFDAISSKDGRIYQVFEHQYNKMRLTTDPRLVGKNLKTGHAHTLPKRGSSSGLALKVATTLRFGDFSDRGFRVFKWQ